MYVYEDLRVSGTDPVRSASAARADDTGQLRAVSDSRWSR
jgi:hypothetical protein